MCSCNSTVTSWCYSEKRSVASESYPARAYYWWCPANDRITRWLSCSVPRDFKPINKSSLTLTYKNAGNPSVAYHCDPSGGTNRRSKIDKVRNLLPVEIWHLSPCQVPVSPYSTNDTGSKTFSTEPITITVFYFNTRCVAPSQNLPQTRPTSFRHHNQLG